MLLGGACGWQSLPLICLISSLTALTALILLHLRAAANSGDGPGRSIFDRPIPFGPFLSLSALVYLLYGRDIQLWLLLHLY